MKVRWRRWLEHPTEIGGGMSASRAGEPWSCMEVTVYSEDFKYFYGFILTKEGIPIALKTYIRRGVQAIQEAIDGQRL